MAAIQQETERDSNEFWPHQSSKGYYLFCVRFALLATRLALAVELCPVGVEPPQRKPEWRISSPSVPCMCGVAIPQRTAERIVQSTPVSPALQLSSKQTKQDPGTLGCGCGLRVSDVLSNAAESCHGMLNYGWSCFELRAQRCAD